MFARAVTMNLKPSNQTSSTRKLEKEIIHLVGEEQCFGDKITFVSQDGAIAVGISFLEAMDQVVEGTPQVKTYEVSNSTWHKIAALQTA